MSSYTWAYLALCVRAWQTSGSAANLSRLARVAKKVSYSPERSLARPEWWWALEGKRLEVAIDIQQRCLSLRQAARELAVSHRALGRWLRGASGRREAARVEAALGDSRVTRRAA